MHLCEYMYLYLYICLNARGYVYVYICIYVRVFSFDLFIPRLFCFFVSLSVSLFFYFNLLSHFRPDLRDHSENNAFPPVLHYPSQC